MDHGCGYTDRGRCGRCHLRRDGELKNAEMWQELDGLLQKHRVTAVWVRGHADNEWNNRCDALAVAEREKLA